SYLFFLAAIAANPAQVPAQSAVPATPDPRATLRYIHASWDSLTRSVTNCQALADTKIAGASVLYLPKGFAAPPNVAEAAERCQLLIITLPRPITKLGDVRPEELPAPGLLYLPNPYVVPGGRFNEMYGWDSYFIIRGLLRAGHVELARGMVDNFFFEIEHYGAMLNANRTYYLTRSQPPFLSSMFLEVYGELRKSGHPDPAWLAKGYADIKKDYEMWNRDPHRAGDTGLARYYDFGDGPPAEAIKDETGFYRKVATYFFFHPAQADSYIVENLPEVTQQVAGRPYSQQVCDVSSATAGVACEHPRGFRLSADYYKGDRSMRESGFDVSFRFGPFGAATHHYAPVCLNSLLYKTEKDLEQISGWLGRTADAEKWRKRAEERKELITRYLWDDKSGLFFDFDFKTGQRSSYRYATTFYPLWAGLATPAQAKAVAKNLSVFEKPGGVAMSTEDSGAQWDLPYGWGNIEMLVVEGLRRYGYNADADRISYEFLSMVAENFRRDGNLREKYNVVTRSSEAHAELGYQMNVVGFGWTNAAFLELLNGLPRDMAERLEKEQELPLPVVANPPR
ncbi:MAG: trehalase family glycosidase, partial [Candidatus Sulfotelmatobacter sp.]